MYTANSHADTIYRGVCVKIYIEKIRHEKNMSVAELSRSSGVARSHIHSIESGEKCPTLPVLCKISKALDVHAAELFSCDDD